MHKKTSKKLRAKLNGEKNLAKERELRHQAELQNAKLEATLEALLKYGNFSMVSEAVSDHDK